jgi:hypothetical protein
MAMTVPTSSETTDRPRGEDHARLGERDPEPAEGGAQEAREREPEAEPGHGGDDLPLIPGAWRANCLELLTRCCLALGRREEAGQAAARTEAVAADFGLRTAIAASRRATAAVALDAADPVAAAERALASAAAADDIGAPVEAALSRLLAGRALGQAAGRSPARPRSPPRPTMAHCRGCRIR